MVRLKAYFVGVLKCGNSAPPYVSRVKIFGLPARKVFRAEFEVPPTPLGVGVPFGNTLLKGSETCPGKLTATVNGGWEASVGYQQSSSISANMMPAPPRTLVLPF